MPLKLPLISRSEKNCHWYCHWQWCDQKLILPLLLTWRCEKNWHWNCHWQKGRSNNWHWHWQWLCQIIGIDIDLNILPLLMSGLRVFAHWVSCGLIFAFRSIFEGLKPLKVEKSHFQDEIKLYTWNTLTNLHGLLMYGFSITNWWIFTRFRR